RLSPGEELLVGKSRLHLAEGGDRDRDVVGQGLPLLRGGDLDLRLEAPTGEDGREQVGADGPDGLVRVDERAKGSRQEYLRQARGAGGFDVVKRGGDAAVGGDD